AGAGGLAEELLDRYPEEPRQARQRRDRHAPVAHLIGVHGLLGDAELLGELHLGDVRALAQLRDARAERDEKRPFLLADRHDPNLCPNVFQGMVHSVGVSCEARLTLPLRVVVYARIIFPQTLLTGFWKGAALWTSVTSPSAIGQSARVRRLPGRDETRRRHRSCACRAGGSVGWASRSARWCG